MTTRPIRNSINRSSLRCGSLLIPLVLACFALSPTARALLPAPTPDGGYLNNNTAEGSGALFSLTTGLSNTANGSHALYSNTTGLRNTANGAQALYHNTTINGISGDHNTANGYQALLNNRNGSDNTATGVQALQANISATGNTASGYRALYHNNSDFNTAIGYQALLHNTTGNFNTAIGTGALSFNSAGSYNIAVGFDAGINLSIGSQNIDIGDVGVTGESNTIRIGFGQDKTYIAGISGFVVPDTAQPVYITNGGQLGVGPICPPQCQPSSERFKDNIKPMDKASEAILALKPVTFRYKKEFKPKGTPQFGLVAEEVQKVNPDLVVLDPQGKPYGVRYDAVNAMLLNEFLKEHKTVQEQGATIARQQKQIEALTAGLQKVSAQIEVSKPAPQTVLNNQ